MPVDRMVAAWLADAAVDLDAARRLALPPVNRLAAYHLQQAAEKLVKAVRVARGLPATKDHDIAALVDELPPDDPLRPLLAPLDDFTPYATSYRYPTVSGRSRPPPEATEIVAHADHIARIAIDIRRALVGDPP